MAPGIFICGTCHKHSYTSRNRARDALKRVRKVEGYQTDGDVYRCPADRRVFHFTTMSSKRSKKVRTWRREAVDRYEVNEFDLVSRTGIPMSETAWWRWYLFDGLGRFGIKPQRTIRLTPDQWRGKVNSNRWSGKVTVIIRNRKEGSK